MNIDGFMKKAGISNLIDIVPSIAAGVVLFLVFGPVSLVMFPVIALAYLAFAVYKRGIKSAGALKREIKESEKAMRAIHSNVEAGTCLVESIGRAVRVAADGSAIGKALASVKERILLGQGLREAINAEAPRHCSYGIVADALAPLEFEYGATGGVSGSAANSAAALEKRHREIKENEGGRLPRYLIMSMVSSAVLPSMATFAFVGYSILYYSAIFLMLYCTVLLGVFPNIYSAFRMKISGLYDG